MKKQEIIDKQKKYLFSCVATYYNEPLVVDHAKGNFVYDVEGNEFLDFFGGILTVSVGHCNEKVTKAIHDQTDKLQHMSTLYATEPQVQLAEKLAQITPGRLEKSFFTNSGTEANETAVLLAQIYTKCQDVITLRHSYSGRRISPSYRRSPVGGSPPMLCRASIIFPTPTAIVVLSDLPILAAISSAQRTSKRRFKPQHRRVGSPRFWLNRYKASAVSSCRRRSISKRLSGS
jgi:hypothetical protein